LTNALESIGKDNLEINKNMKKKWMTEKILQMMEVRRIVKNDPDKYKESQKCIKREIRKAKEIWMKNQCAEIEKLERKQFT